MNAFNNTTGNAHKNRTTNAWGPGKNYDTKIGRTMRLSSEGEVSGPVNTGYNTQPYMASSPSYLANMAARSDKSIHDDFAVNYDVQIPHAYLEKPYVGFSGPNYKFMKHRKPPGGPAGTEPNPVEAAGGAMVEAKAAAGPEETGEFVERSDQDHWQPVGVSEGWTAHLDDDDWEDDSDGDPMIWTEDTYWNVASKTVPPEIYCQGALKPKGTWATNYRPTKIRVTFECTEGVTECFLWPYDSEDNLIYDEENYTSGQEGDLDFSEGLDIVKLYFQFKDADNGEYTAHITNIEFYESANIAWDSTNNQWVWTASSGSIKIHDQSNWARDFFPKKIRFTIIGDGNTQTVYLRDINSNNIMIKSIVPPSGVATEYIFELNWHKAIHTGRGAIDTFGFTTSNNVSVRNIEFMGILTTPSLLNYYRFKKREQRGNIQPTPYLI